MTDRAVQPEAPTLDSDARNALADATWLDRDGVNIEDAIRRLHHSGYTVVGAASQERPQPPLHGHQYGGDWVECTDEHPGVAQERPHPCTDCAEDAFTGSGRGICAYHEAAAQERPPIDVADIEEAMRDLITDDGHDWAFAGSVHDFAVLLAARLAGGSVTSPEPRP
jgi:hypothetical protein